MVSGLASESELARTILETARKPGSVLFAGAGVAKRAGLPNWEEFIESLAVAAEPYEPETAHLVRKRLANGLLTHAAELFGKCPEIPAGVKQETLAAPFRSERYNADALRALVALPFDTIVTTNFDRSLHDAYAQVHEVSPLCAELHDPSLKRAIYNWQEPFIARIHGRAEIPATMVLDITGYERTEQDRDYTDFLMHILTKKVCLFIGYSFVDPAISRILDVVDERVGSAFPELHVALVPEPPGELSTRLARYNVHTRVYDGADGHAALWHAVREALSLYRRGVSKPARVRPRALDGAHRMLAASYARMSASREVEPLRTVGCEGMLLALLPDTGTATEDYLVAQVRKYLPLSAQEAATLVSSGIGGLATKGWVAKSGRGIERARSVHSELPDDLHVLVRGVTNRLLVTQGKEAGDEEESVINELLEELVLARGWDLGASLASAKSSDAFDIGPAVDGTLDRLGGGLGYDTRRAIAAACRSLIERPNRAESEILARLARLAFGVEMALERGRSAVVYPFTLPERVYLDANVLMPAIAEGHPYRASYVAAIKKLQEACRSAGMETRILVLDVFLNEIVTHRLKATTFVQEGGLEDKERLARYIAFAGANYTNVFVGGYASIVGLGQKRVSFNDYLESAAPYKTEDGLSEFLKTLGIETVSSAHPDGRERTLYREMYGELQRAYEQHAEGKYSTKHTVLIEHEACQLARLQHDLTSAIRAVFITADSRLRRLAVGDVLGPVSEALFSHIGLLQLIDILVGLEGSPESLARLLWAVEARDEEHILRGYFVDRALRQYDAAMAMSAPRILDQIVSEAKEIAKQEGIPLAFQQTGTEVAKTFSFLDRFEEIFFEEMAREIRKQQAESKS